MEKYRKSLPEGIIFSVFIILLFTFRFFIEFVKTEQVEFEKGMALNMGQWLSIPAVAFGFAIIFSLMHKQKKALKT